VPVFGGIYSRKKKIWKTIQGEKLFGIVRFFTGRWESSVYVFKKESSAGCWWHTPVILATQKAEIRRITVQSQPRQTVWRDPISKNPSQKKKKK
jgi:hypothetical protein